MILVLFIDVKTHDTQSEMPYKTKKKLKKYIIYSYI